MITSSFLKAIGLNCVTNSLGFLIQNQGDRLDKNVYMVFPAHTLPSNMVVVPFLFSNLAAQRILYFDVIGVDKAVDVAVAVFQPSHPENVGWSFGTERIHLYKSIPPQYSTSSTFYYAANSSQLREKTVKTTTVENFSFTGPSDMIQFFYPKSVLLQQPCLPGTSGSPVVDHQLGLIAFVTGLLGRGPDYEPVALHCSILWTVVLLNIIPRYRANPTNNYDSLAALVAQGVEKAYLGFLGQYFDQGSIQYCPQLEQAPNMDGFVIFGFYRTYNLATNTFLETTLTKKDLDNTNIRVYSPFNQYDLVPSFLYNWLSRAQVRFIIVSEIRYRDKYDGQTKSVRPSNYVVEPVSSDNSLSTFFYHADPSASFSMDYFYYDTEWTLKTEVITPAPVPYSLYGETTISLTSKFPPFALGNETVGNVWNMTTESTPYNQDLLIDPTRRIMY